VSAASARRRGDDLDDDLDEDTENDDVTRQSGDITSQSSADGLSLSAFESFVRGVVGNIWKLSRFNFLAKRQTKYFWRS